MATKAQQERERIENNKLANYFKKVQTLLGSTVYARLTHDKKAYIHFAYNAGTDAVTAAFDLAKQEPIGAAIFPLKAVTVEHARENAQTYVSKTLAWCAELGWDAKQVPSGHSLRVPYRSHAYQEAEAKRSRFKLFTRSEKSYVKEGEPDLCAANQDDIDRYVNNAMQDAALQFDMFAFKMLQKVGDCVSAELRPLSGVWGLSYLDVTKEDGPQLLKTETWKTQQIVNYSVLGNAYYQWPSRIVKA